MVVDRSLRAHTWVEVHSHRDHEDHRRHDHEDRGSDLEDSFVSARPTPKSVYRHSDTYDNAICAP